MLNETTQTTEPTFNTSWGEAIEFPKSLIPVENHAPHILVVDDDPTFRSIIAGFAKRANINLTACANVRELAAMSHPQLFDVAIVDYYLDGFKEHMKGTDIASLMDSTPVVLTSGSDHPIVAHEAWPQSVRKFIPKKVGVRNLLHDALKLLSRAENN